MGFAKAAGNYACSLIADHEAQKKGCAQVLWLDGVERKYIEEVGSMNIMFKNRRQDRNAAAAALSWPASRATAY